MYLLFAVVGNFADLKDVSLVSELFLIFVGKFDFVGVKEMLETADGECSFSIEDDVIFWKNLQSWEGSLGDVFFIVDVHELLVNIFGVSVSWALGVDGGQLLHFLTFLFFSTLIKDFVKFLLSSTELGLDLWVTADRFSDPGMRGDLFNFRSFWGVEGDHSGEEVLKGITEVTSRSLSAVSFPEDVESFFFDEFVVRVIRGSFLEGRVSSIHDEENDSWGEDINALAFVFFGGDFRGHVAFSSQFGSQHTGFVFSSQVTGESEISNFEDVKVGK